MFDFNKISILNKINHKNQNFNSYISISIFLLQKQNKKQKNNNIWDHFSY